VRTADLELAARCRAGDADAFEELYRQHARRLFNLVLRMIGSADEAEDLLQEVFLQAWRRAPEYDPQRGSFSAWIFTIARNRRIDAMRRGRHAISGDDPTTLPEPPRNSRAA
jgi:RNA polymerase sigma-70 factor (ECF subfamily)